MLSSTRTSTTNSLATYATSFDGTLASYRSTNDNRVLAAETLTSTIATCGDRGLVYSTTTSQCGRLPIPGTICRLD
jgi:hypothetical protein